MLTLLISSCNECRYILFFTPKLAVQTEENINENRKEDMDAIPGLILMLLVLLLVAYLAWDWYGVGSLDLQMMERVAA
jgi:hypothetical protein